MAERGKQLNVPVRQWATAHVIVMTDAVPLGYGYRTMQARLVLAVLPSHAN